MGETFLANHFLDAIFLGKDGPNSCSWKGGPCSLRTHLDVTQKNLSPKVWLIPGYIGSVPFHSRHHVFFLFVKFKFLLVEIYTCKSGVPRWVFVASDRTS